MSADTLEAGNEKPPTQLQVEAAAVAMFTADYADTAYRWEGMTPEQQHVYREQARTALCAVFSLGSPDSVLLSAGYEKALRDVVHALRSDPYENTRDDYAFGRAAHFIERKFGGEA